MSSEADDFLQQITELKQRVASLEARVGELSAGSLLREARESRERRSQWESPGPPPVAPSQPRPYPSTAAMPVAPTNRSLETRIGSQLFNRVGIVAVLIGVAWFLKFAIDNQWIGPAARVIVGLVAGFALIAFSERFRASGYGAFSYSLKAIATGVLYLSMWAAYALFHLIPAEIAFLSMILVTAMNALMCWMQNSEVLAFYAAVGGFLTPILLAVHVRNEFTLFSYLLVLDIAMMVLIALRPWPRLLLAAFAGTTFYAIGWYASDYSDERFGLTLFFILAFFLLFAISPQLLRSLRLSNGAGERPVKDSLVLRLVPAVNAGLGFSEVFVLMSNPGHLGMRPWIALPFAAFYLAMLRVGRVDVEGGAPAALPPLYLVISVVFLTIAIPMEAHGRWIAIGWFLEYAILLWFSAKKAISSFRLIAGCVLALGIIALLIPSDTFNPPVAATILFNPRFATFLVAIGCCLAAAWIASGAVTALLPEAAKTTATSMPSTSMHATGAEEAWRALAGASALSATLLLLIAVCLEIHAYWSGVDASFAMRGSSIDEQFSYSAWLMLLGAALLSAGFWRKSAFLRWQALVLLAVSIGKVFLFDTRQLSQGYRILSFLGLGMLLLAVSFAYQRDWLGLRGGSSRAA